MVLNCCKNRKAVKIALPDINQVISNVKKGRC
ncbi:MAG: hypothetical protein POELPBGB_01986 [Bacteroidia bacterium]|nr:hypothetical protein [Bacteroidia bacterium]